MQKNTLLHVGIIMVVFSIFKQYNIAQISEKTFFEKYINNTTQIDLYGNSSIYVYTNNSTRSSYYINTKNDTDFINQLEEFQYTNEFLYKNSNTSNTYNNFVTIGFLLLMLNLSRTVIGMGYSQFISSNNKVTVSLKDVAGLDHNKKEIFEFVDFIQNRDKYINFGARMPRGALLYGPPGTGKTLLAKAIAGECKIPFISVSGSDFSQMYVGVGAARIRSLFKEARKKAPCIIFIDEIDALARSRTNLSSGGQIDKDNTLNRLLVELDGFEENDNVLLFGATNRLDILDKALLRPGRFDRKIRFDLPEKNDRIKIFEYYLNKMTIKENISELSQHLGKISIGFSCADIANICNEASILTIRAEQEYVTKKLLENAVDYVILGPEKETFRLTEKERIIVAYHESGHTITSYFLENAQCPIKVSIMPRGKSALGFSQSESFDTKLNSREELLDKICVLLGGRVAESLFCKSITTGACDDIEKATKLAYQFVTIFGMNKQIGTFFYDKKKHHYGTDIKNNIDKQVSSILNKSLLKVRELLLKHGDLLTLLFTELLEKETLYNKDLDRIFNTAFNKPISNPISNPESS